MNATAIRRVEPEILDDLTADDPRAVASRRDLGRINALMFQPGIMARLLRRHVSPAPLRILEIGAGDGRFMLAVARRLVPIWPKVELTLLDRVALGTPALAQAFERLGWRVEFVTDDVFDWLSTHRQRSFDAITTNLFLHHFEPPALRRLFTELQAAAPIFVATEPRRSAFALSATRALRAIGANDVTRHDAPASVIAGFNGNELSALWNHPGATPVDERQAGLFTHIFVGRSANAGNTP
jgi:spermidine synthase